MALNKTLEGIIMTCSFCNRACPGIDFDNYKNIILCTSDIVLYVQYNII